jgi:hypothetical protein
VADFLKQKGGIYHVSDRLHLCAMSYDRMLDRYQLTARKKWTRDDGETEAIPKAAKWGAALSVRGKRQECVKGTVVLASRLDCSMVNDKVMPSHK